MSENMKVKDIITVTLLTLCNIVIYFATSMLCVVPVVMIFYPAIISLLEGIVFMMIGTKVPKKGAFLIYSAVHGIFGFYIPYFIGYMIAGIIAELLLNASGRPNYKTLGISYVITQMIAAITSVILPYRVSLEATLERAGEGGADLVQATSDMLTTGIAIACLVATLVAAVFGAYIGYQVVKKHVLKSAEQEEI